MQPVIIVLWIYAAMCALSFVEAYVEGRNSWNAKKVGWKINLPGGYQFSGYHFFLFFVMLPLFIFLPLAVTGWDITLFGILLSAYLSGMVLEDFVYFIVNPVVRFKEFFTSFTDYYPWIKIKGKKIIPLGYIIGIGLSLISWYLFVL